MNRKKVRILRRKIGLNFKIKHRKAKKAILSGRFGDPYGRAGDPCRIRETPGKSGRVGICGKLETSLLQSVILEAKKWKF